MARNGNFGESQGILAALFGESMFYNMSTADDDGIPDNYECTEFGNYWPEEVSKKLEGRIREAEKESFPGESERH